MRLETRSDGTKLRIRVQLLIQFFFPPVIHKKKVSSWSNLLSCQLDVICNILVIY